MRTDSKTRKGDREIISVSLPLDVYRQLTSVCLLHGYNRSALVSIAVTDYLRNYRTELREDNEHVQL